VSPLPVQARVTRGGVAMAAGRRPSHRGTLPVGSHFAACLCPPAAVVAAAAAALCSAATAAPTAAAAAGTDRGCGAGRGRGRVSGCFAAGGAVCSRASRRGRRGRCRQSRRGCVQICRWSCWRRRRRPRVCGGDGPAAGKGVDRSHAADGAGWGGAVRPPSPPSGSTRGRRCSSGGGSGGGGGGARGWGATAATWRCTEVTTQSWRDGRAARSATAATDAA